MIFNSLNGITQGEQNYEHCSEGSLLGIKGRSGGMFYKFLQLIQEHGLARNHAITPYPLP